MPHYSPQDTSNVPSCLQSSPGAWTPSPCSEDQWRSLVSIVPHQSSSIAVTGKGCLYHAVSLQGHQSLEPSVHDIDFIHCPFSLIAPVAFLLVSYVQSQTCLRTWRNTDTLLSWPLLGPVLYVRSPCYARVLGYNESHVEQLSCCLASSMMLRTQKNLNFHTHPTHFPTIKMLNVSVAVTTSPKSLKSVVRTRRWTCVGSRDLPVFALDIESNRKRAGSSHLREWNRLTWGPGTPHSCLEPCRPPEGVAFWICCLQAASWVSEGCRFQTPVWVSEGSSSARVTHLFAVSPQPCPELLMS